MLESATMMCAYTGVWRRMPNSRTTLMVKYAPTSLSGDAI